MSDDRLETAIYRADGGLVDTAAVGYTITPAKPEDRPEIERIWRAEFDDPTDDGHQDALDACLDPDHDLYPYSNAYVATDGRGCTIGFGLVELRNTGDMSDCTTLPESEFTGRDGYLYLSAVRESWQGKGVGTLLFRERLEWLLRENANRVYGVAWQNPEGPTSDPLFRKFGFEKVTVLPPEDYYKGRDCPVCTDVCDCSGVVYRREL